MQLQLHISSHSGLRRPTAGGCNVRPVRVGGRAAWVRRATATVALLMLALAGCGSSGSGTNADPAVIVPASAPLYASVAIQPQGGSDGQAVVAARKLSHLREPYGRIAEALLGGEGAKLQFKRDIEPWAGERAGIFVTKMGTSGSAAAQSLTGASAQSLAETVLSAGVSTIGAEAFAGGGAQGAIVLDTKTESGAKSFLEKWASQRQARTSSYRGVAYRVSPKGAAAAIVKRFFVVGSESGVKDAIDTSLGAAALARAGGYPKPSADAVATVQLAPRRLSAADGAGALGLLGSLFDGAESVSMAVTLTSSSASLQGRARYASAADSSSSPLFAPGGAQALAALPGGSWLAAGVGDVGASSDQALALLRGVFALGLGSAFSSIGGEGIERLLMRLASPKAKLDSIFKGWAGAGGVFVNGTGLFNLQAALTIASHDPAASKAAVGRLGSLLRQSGALVQRTSIPGTDAAITVKLTGFPAVLSIADGQSKLIVGLGQASVQGALAPASTLSSSPSYQAAATALGGGLEPSLILEVPALLGFLEGLGLTQNPPFSGAVPYLKSLGTLTAGSATSGATTRFKVALGLA